ncbi:MlaD family protein [Gordonia sp. CPCC 205333]|uniref:MlaD family protein n=1 Tax=Gordonia sp. CPCC 205333 TaxID=3140790 RepID=UPI003AF40597
MSRRQVFDAVKDVMGVGRVPSEDRARRHQLLVGLLATVVVGIVAAALGLVYLRPLGYADYTAQFANASGVRSGDQVRIAGILVGEVKALTVDGDHVRVEFSVKKDLHIGSDTSIDIRLLTPVGGRYLQLIPKGRSPLGVRPVPAERVTGTYDLTALLEEVTPKAAALDGAKLRELITTVESGLVGQPDAVARILDTTSSLTEQFARRSTELSGALKVSDEYARATAADRQILFTLIRNIGEIGLELGTRHEQVHRVFALLTKLFQFFERPLVAYADKIERPVNDLADILERLEPSVRKVDSAVSAVENALARVKGLVGGDGGGLTIDDSDATVSGVSLCVPSASRKC